MAAGNTYTPLATTTFASAATSYTFSSISSSYTSLILIVNNQMSAASGFKLRFNGDTASNYSYHAVYGNGSTANAEQIAPVNVMLFGSSPAASATSGIFGPVVMDILDYANTDKYKTVRALSGGDQNGSGGVYFASNSWRNTAAITSISIFCSSGNVAEFSQFALYGIKE